MRMGIGADMLMIMALSVIAFDCYVAEAAQKKSAGPDTVRAEKQLKDLQIVYGLDNAAMPARPAKNQASNTG